ncbi:MAG: helix-turn-helix domain-containing protein [Bacteroidales bacterium]|nr:helix-turn-helix domain-containing protein [Bacteroidales bacterium]
MEALKEYLAELIRPIVIQAVQDALAELNPRPLKRYLTPEEAWTHIKVSRATFYRLVGRGVIEILKIGNKSLVDADRLDEAVEKREIYRYKHYR